MQARSTDTNAALQTRLLFISAVAVITTIAICAMAVGLVAGVRRPSASASAELLAVSGSTVLKAGRGKVVYSDNFSDPARAWSSLTSDTSGSSWTYSANGYEIVATGYLVHSRKAPYATVFQQLSMSLTAKQSRDTPPDAGFGVVCWRGEGEAMIRYEMVVTGEKWWVLRRDGVAALPSNSYLLKVGSAGARAGPIAISVIGVCATLADGVSTRIGMFINGSSVADLTDVPDVLPGHGWRAGVFVVSSTLAPSRVTFTEFEERTLAA